MSEVHFSPLNFCTGLFYLFNFANADRQWLILKANKWELEDDKNSSIIPISQVKQQNKSYHEKVQ